MGESNYKHTEKSVKEASFIPTEIAVSVVAKIQEDDKKLLERHVKLAEVIRQNFLKIEEETQKHTIEFFNNLKTKISEKLSSCKQAYIALTKEKEDVQSKYHAMYTVPSLYRHSLKSISSYNMTLPKNSNNWRRRKKGKSNDLKPLLKNSRTHMKRKWKRTAKAKTKW